MTEPRWRKSSYSNNGQCVEVADVGAVLIRNSNAPGDGTLRVDRLAVAAYVDGCREGEFDDVR